MTHYVYWQYVLAPRWIIQFSWNLQRMLVRLFSVSLVLRTLFAYWRKDAVSYSGGGLQGMFVAFAWNQISRSIGFLIRAVTLTIWMIVSMAVLAGSLGALALFLAWPVASIFLIVWGLVMAI